MKRHEAISIIAGCLSGRELVVASTGMISRELFTVRDTPRNFYMMGSMGLAPSIGLGLALCLPHIRIVTLEGDGSSLMNLGTMATVAHNSPPNLTQFVLDNGCHDSTGGQPTAAPGAAIEEFARAAHYRLAMRAGTESQLRDAARAALDVGPAMVVVKVDKGAVHGIDRVSHTPEQITERFKEQVAL